MQLGLHFQRMAFAVAVLEPCAGPPPFSSDTQLRHSRRDASATRNATAA